LKVYTKSGDKGSTSLVSGRRVSKDEILLEAYGTVDELNAFVGLLSSENLEKGLSDQLILIQNHLFNMGSLLAKDGYEMEHYPTIKEDYITNLESWIDQMTDSLQPLTTFILPSGSKAIALAHVCRTVCRRAERRVVACEDHIESMDRIVRFLNRLSDYFFTCSRYIAHCDQIDEVSWSKNI